MQWHDVHTGFIKMLPFVHDFFEGPGTHTHTHTHKHYAIKNSGAMDK